MNITKLLLGIIIISSLLLVSCSTNNNANEIDKIDLIQDIPNQNTSANDIIIEDSALELGIESLDGELIDFGELI